MHAIRPNVLRSLAFAVILIPSLLRGQLACAQLPTANLTRIDPPSAVPGQSVECSLSGTDLLDVTELVFSHPGIQAKPAMTAGDIVTPPLPIANKFVVSVASGIEPGLYEVRAKGYFGLSTARAFMIDDHQTTRVADPGSNLSREKSLAISTNTVIAGTVAARGMDWFRFRATTNQTITIEVFAERLDSRLDSQLVIYDSTGRELDRNRDNIGRDSRIRFTAPNDGVYHLSLSDILFRGGAEHFYRLKLTDGPSIDYVFPPMGIPGQTSTFTAHGANLPGSSLDFQLTIPTTNSRQRTLGTGTPRAEVLPTFLGSPPELPSIRVGVASAPIVFEQTESAVQSVSMPCEIAGRFDEPNDEDVYELSLTAGEKVAVEVIAERMNFPVDPLILVTQCKSGEPSSDETAVADNDDMPSFFSVDGKDTINFDTLDSALCFTAQDTGTYRIRIVNQFGDGGAGHIYRLAIRPPRPDFHLVATTERPLATNRAGYSVAPVLRRGAAWGIRILCARQDQFHGDVVVTAEGLPQGVRSEPLTLSQDTREGILVVKADQDVESWAGSIRIIGKHTQAEQTIEREARFASLVWGHVFADSIRVRSRLTHDIPLSVCSHEVIPTQISIGDRSPRRVAVGETLNLDISLVDSGTRTGDLTIEPRGLTGMLRNPPTVNIAEDATVGQLKISFAPNGNFQVKPGRYQFTLHGTGVSKYRKNVRAHELAIAKQAEAEKQVQQVTAQVEEAKTRVKVSQENLKAAIASKAPDTITKAKQELQLAQKEMLDLNQRFNFAGKAERDAKRLVTQAEANSRERSVKFATWSELITVEVVDAE